MLGRRPNDFLRLSSKDRTILVLVNYWIRQSQSDKTVLALGCLPVTCPSVKLELGGASEAAAAAAADDGDPVHDEAHR